MNVNTAQSNSDRSHVHERDLVWVPAVSPTVQSVPAAAGEEVPRWVQSLWWLVDVGLLVIVLYAYAGG